MRLAKTKTIISVILSCALVLSAQIAFAAPTSTQPAAAAPETGFVDPGLAGDGDPINPYNQTYDPGTERASGDLTKEFYVQDVIVRVTNWILTFLGVIAFVILIYAGFLWGLAYSEENVEKAKKIIVEVIIGVIVTLAAYTIVFTLIGGRGRLFFY